MLLSTGFVSALGTLHEVELIGEFTASYWFVNGQALNKEVRR
jgi:hypothetical protein